MTSDADERPTDETAPEVPGTDGDALPAAATAPSDQSVAEAPAEPAAQTPAEAVAETPAETVAETLTETVAETPTADMPVETAAQAPPEITVAAAPDAPTEPEVQPTPDAPAESTADAPAEQAADTPAESPTEVVAASAAPTADAANKPAKKPRRRKPRERRKAPELPKTRAPLPLDELRDASRSTMNLFGPRKALRDALGVLAPREKQELNVLIAADEDHRPRARNIANGSIGAGRIDKAMAATIVSMAPQEELWTVLLDKEQAAQKLGRIREAKQRDKQRADRAAERANRADRVSREDMAKASDGRVGATIRFVNAGDEKRERREKDAAKKKSGGSVLDRLGY